MNIIIDENKYCKKFIEHMTNIFNINDDEYCKIPLKNKKSEIIGYTIIDKDDYEKVNKSKWCCNICRKKYNNSVVYYCVSGKINKKKILLSHYIIGKPTTPDVVDHINNNPFDNRKENLRIVSQKINAQNKKKNIKESITSKYIGVCLIKKSNKWKSRYADINLGTYENEIDAAIVYDKYVLINFGKNASTNNLIKYEDVLQLTNNDIVPIKNKIDNLPKNITKYNNLYKISIAYNYKVYRDCVKTLDEAIKILEKFKNEISIIKKNELEIHNKLPILRNKDGYAIINIFNKKNEIICSTIVDDDKWHELSLIIWGIGSDYICAKINRKTIRLSRYLLNAPDNIRVDHINNNTLDNRITNLRFTTAAENAYNRSSSKNSLSIFKGITKRIDKSNNITYRAQIEKEGKCYCLGTYLDENMAAIAYNIKARELFGDFAYSNKIEVDNNTYNQYKDIILEKWNTPPKKYIGIKDRKTSYLASINKDKIEYSLGSYKIDTIAALAYNLKYIEFYGEENLEKLNIIDIDNDTYEEYKDIILNKWKKLKINKT
jgi:hypothetical protein